MRITYGHKVVAADDQFVSLAEAVRENNEKTPGNALVDQLPFREWARIPHCSVR